MRGAQVAYVIVLAGLVAGLAYIWQGPHSVRAGTFTLAGALFVAVAARFALPERRAGMLASRRRYIDVTALAILAIGLLVAGLVLPIRHNGPADNHAPRDNSPAGKSTAQ